MARVRLGRHYRAFSLPVPVSHLSNLLKRKFTAFTGLTGKNSKNHAFKKFLLVFEWFPYLTDQVSSITRHPFIPPRNPLNSIYPDFENCKNCDLFHIAGMVRLAKVQFATPTRHAVRCSNNDQRSTGNEPIAVERPSTSFPMKT